LPFIFEADAGVTSDDKATPAIASDMMTAIALMAEPPGCVRRRPNMPPPRFGATVIFKTALQQINRSAEGLDGRSPRDQLHSMLGATAALPNLHGKNASA
jgi:hypothetical protein